MSKRFWRWRAAALGAAVALLGSANAAPQSAAAAKPQILVAAEKTEFKDAVMAKIKESLEKRGYEFTAIDVKDLPARKADDYRAVVILNTVFAWRPRHGARKFLSDLTPEQKRRIVMVNTARDTKWKLKDEGVHAITSASLPGNVAEAVTYVLEQVDAIVKAP